MQDWLEESWNDSSKLQEVITLYDVKHIGVYLKALASLSWDHQTNQALQAYNGGCPSRQDGESRQGIKWPTKLLDTKFSIF
jgi:hypothetical protein